ncbi:MAG TPA: hypothetical protein VFT50_07420 [Baekduia sp.]|nr:hypothetical protein [Baekduia sp.]
MPTSHQNVRLAPGRHRSPDDGVCVMELASMLAGEPFTDHPLSVSPTLASALRGYNDGLDDGRRQTLKRFAAAAVGTVATRRAERERRRLIQAWLANGAMVGGIRAALNRYLEASDPYTMIRNIGKRVVAREDEGLHARTLQLLDDLVAVGQPAQDRLAAAAPHAEPAPAPAEPRR